MMHRLMLLLILLQAQPCFAQDLQPGEPIEYRPMDPGKWKQKGTSTRLYPWEGKHIVVLTTKKELDPAIMAIFVKRLDAGWELYSNIIDRPPVNYNLWKGKATVAMVPDASYTCGLGCGNIANTGIEIAGFYRDHFGGPGDYAHVKRNRNVFQHYYFYEFGRNWFTFGARHSGFTTGYAVFMRYVILDTLGCVDEDIKTRRAIDRAEEIYARSTQDYFETFTYKGRKGNKLVNAKGVPIQLTDVNCMYASVMLKLRKEYGGNEWLKRFYHYLFDCMESPNPTVQAWNWMISASCAAGKDLTPLFVNRWRFPVPARVQQALAKVNWSSKDVSPMQIMLSLPIEEVPPPIAVQHPTFVTPELRKMNLLVDASFEDSQGLWKPRGSAQTRKGMHPVTETSHDGKRSMMIECNRADDAWFVQTVPVKAKTRYLLCGWIKTRDVEIKEHGGQSGANLSIDGTWDRTNTLVGNHDWTYVAMIFNSGERSEVNICARLGFTSSKAKGQAWFDDLVFAEMPQK